METNTKIEQLGKALYRKELTQERLDKALRYWKYNSGRYWGLCAYFSDKYTSETGSILYYLLKQLKLLSGDSVYLDIPMKTDIRVKALKQVQTYLYGNE